MGAAASVNIAEEGRLLGRFVNSEGREVTVAKETIRCGDAGEAREIDWINAYSFTPLAGEGHAEEIWLYSTEKGGYCVIEESAGEESVKRAREEAGFYRPPQSNQEAEEEEGASAAAPGAAAAAKVDGAEAAAATTASAVPTPFIGVFRDLTIQDPSKGQHARHGEVALEWINPYSFHFQTGSGDEIWTYSSFLDAYLQLSGAEGAPVTGAKSNPGRAHKRLVMEMEAVVPPGEEDEEEGEQQEEGEEQATCLPSSTNQAEEALPHPPADASPSVEAGSPLRHHRERSESSTLPRRQSDVPVPPEAPPSPSKAAAGISKDGDFSLKDTQVAPADKEGAGVEGAKPMPAKAAAHDEAAAGIIPSSE